MALPPMDRRDQQADIRVARRQLLRNRELGQRAFVVLVHPVDALAERKVAFGQIGLQAQRCLRFAPRFCFP